MAKRYFRHTCLRHSDKVVRYENVVLHLQVIDRSGSLTGAFSDLSKVEKYEISQDAYDKRSGKVLVESKIYSFTSKLFNYNFQYMDFYILFS